jgi:hypothetical protein
MNAVQKLRDSGFTVELTDDDGVRIRPQCPPDLAEKLRAEKPHIVRTLRAEAVIEKAIHGLPVELVEVFASPLFSATDFSDIEKGSLKPDQIRIYVGSWLVNNRQFPTPICTDFEDRLAQYC